MATYNGADYILAQLNSFMDQTSRPDEVVITDDCSIDNTVALIREFSKIAPFEIKIHVNNRNFGYSENFNNALSKTSGDLIFLSDQDDVWFPNKIEHMISFAEKNPHYFIYMNDALLTDANLRSVNLTKYGQIMSAGLSNASFIMGCCCLIRREFLDIVMPIPANLKSHDDWLVGIADDIDGKLINKAVLQYYRRHGNNESQIIVNSLTKVNQRTVFLQNIKSAFRPKSSENFANKIQQMQYFVDGLHEIMPRVPLTLRPKLKAVIEERQSNIKFAQVRADLRQSGLFVRIFRALKLFKSGYPQKTRIKNMARDILG